MAQGVGFSRAEGTLRGNQTEEVTIMGGINHNEGLVEDMAGAMNHNEGLVEDMAGTNHNEGLVEDLSGMNHNEGLSV